MTLVRTLIRIALKAANESRCRYRMGAVVADGPRVLAARANLRRNAPDVDYLNATFHAEEAALRRVRSPAGTVLYVARVDASGNAAMARPCPRCERMLAEAGVVGVYFTTWDGEVDYLRLG
ncbi:hypothetical protein [Streptomyces sp. NPDC051014]|uniref:hypothetical protein n=1 Tax=Streptomyces sp. NPDC051014 TaxID=3155751 RepID=UPI0033EE126C